ncbi:MAG: hypothetical protein GF405_07785 [Candidatus Eisenbacteria bacterium]|nr:hypothetical protein [Candidatus Eisenbacteria bacterium]
MSGSRRTRWLVRRAAAMGPAELGLRLSRGLRDRMRRRSSPVPQEELLSLRQALGGRDVADARGMLRERLRPWNARGHPADVRETLAGLGVPVEETTREADRILEGSLPAFGHTRLDVGPEPDWHRDPASGLEWPRDVWWSRVDFRFDPDVDDPRYVWEVNRHLHLAALARAYTLTADERYAAAVWRQMSDWVRRNPPHFGINWSSALEVAIRLISWTLSLGLVGPDGASDDDVEGVLTSCSLQARHVSDNLTVYGSSRNNHLIGEAAGLLAAGVALPFLEGASTWTAKAREVLEREIPAQIADDGISLEQTFHYQVFVIEFALVAIACARAMGSEMSARFTERVGAAATALTVLADGAAAPPSVGDEDGGRAYLLDDRPERQSRAAAAAVLLAAGRKLPEDVDPADLASSVWVLGSEPVRGALEGRRAAGGGPSRAYPDGGYFVLGDGRAHGVVDCGPLGLGSIAAHGHADCLSLEVARDGDWLVVDPGTYCYHRERRWRDHFRSTRAHNTVTVDGRDQSEMLGPFLWGARAGARAVFWSAERLPAIFCGSHDGYRSSLGTLHRRTVLLLRSGVWVVVDTVEGDGDHEVCATFQLAPGLELEGSGEGLSRRFAASDGRRLAFVFSGPEGTDTEVTAGLEDPPTGWVSEGFGHRTPATALVARTEGTLPVTLATVVLAGVDADVAASAAPEGTGAMIEIRSGADVERVLAGTYRGGATVFQGLAGYAGPFGADRDVLGADVVKWGEDGRAVDFEPVRNELRPGTGLQ